MDLLNEKEKQVKLAIIFSFITIPLFIISIALAVFVIYPVLLGNVAGSIAVIAGVATLQLIILGIAIASLIYYIIVLIYAFKLENKTSAILLTVGLFLGIVGLVGLFILLNEINQLKTKNSNQEFSGLLIS